MGAVCCVDDHGGTAPGTVHSVEPQEDLWASTKPLPTCANPANLEQEAERKEPIEEKLKENASERAYSNPRRNEDGTLAMSEKAAAKEEAVQPTKEPKCVADAQITIPEEIPQEYEVKVFKAASVVNFGLMFDMSDSKYPTVLSISPGSLVDDWNARQPEGERNVSIGDALLSVNGKAEEVGANMVLELRGVGDLTVKLKPPKKRNIVIPKEGKELGLKLRQGQTGLIVHGSDGLAATAGVRPQDRIMKVNSAEGNPTELFALLNSSEVVELEVHSFSD